MVNCKFFLEGRCRFAEKCNNDHPQNASYQKESLKNPPVRQRYFSWSEPQQQIAERKQTHFENLLHIVKGDTVNSVNGGQWLFSCYAPLLRRTAQVPTKINEEVLPNLMDFSPEELRWEEISSKMNGKFDEYTVRLQQLTQHYITIKKALIILNHVTSNFIVRYEKGESINTAGTAFASFVPSSFPTITTAPPQNDFFKFEWPSVSPLKLQSQHPAAAPITFKPCEQESLAASFFRFTLPSQQPNQSAVNSSLPTQTVSFQLSQSDFQKYKAESFSFGKIPRNPPTNDLR